MGRLFLLGAGLVAVAALLATRIPPPDRKSALDDDAALSTGDVTA